MSELAKIEVITDGGPWASHNYPCPVNHDDHAVIDVATGVFYPSWSAQASGWRLVHADGWRLALLNWLFPGSGGPFPTPTTQVRRGK